VRRELWLVLLSLGCALAWALFPSASRAQDQGCVVTVTVVGGQTFTFVVNVPPGTPLSAISLPVTQAVTSVSESCANNGGDTATSTTSSTSTATTPTTSTQTTTTPQGTPTGTDTSTTATSTIPVTTTTTPTTTTVTTPTIPSITTPAAPASGKAGAHKRTRTTTDHTRPGAGASQGPPGSGGGLPISAAPTTAAGGVPTAGNPTFSFALPGPARIGVPNFFIDNFQIPPFLLPIYQAAGIEYGVPWQVLAAINAIETDYGRNLSVSSAGAVGWMQFLPSTWREWGVDATGSGYADPYNPVDAVFTAARYLQAAGAAKNLARAIFAYNHATWYVQSVLLRAQLIGGMPRQLVGALSELVQGHFPVAATATYADTAPAASSGGTVSGGGTVGGSDGSVNGSNGTGGTANPSTTIFAAVGAPVVAVNDGRIVALGNSPTLGNYVVLEDDTGNTYTYAQLGSMSPTYAVPKPVEVSAASVTHQLSSTSSQAAASSRIMQTPASAGTQTAARAAARGAFSKLATTTTTPASTTRKSRNTSAGGSGGGSSSTAKQRLFAYPARPASYAAGGQRQLDSSTPITNFREYFSDALHLAPNQYTLAPLQVGSIVIAGTVLGHIGVSSASLVSSTGSTTSAPVAAAPHMVFMIQPAGAGAPFVDPKPILDGWKLLEATAIYRANAINPFFGPDSKNVSVGEVLLMSKAQLEQRVLSDPHARIYACGRRDIQAGLIDRRILAAIEFLSSSGLYPTVSGLECGATAGAADGVDPAGSTGASLDISAIDGIPLLHHQGPGSIGAITLRRLLTLQGAMAPNEIISSMSAVGQPATISLPDHANRIQIIYTPAYGSGELPAGVRSLLRPGQWIQLISRIAQLPEPTVPTRRSTAAIRTNATG
jgi:hypothetical protein